MHSRSFPPLNLVKLEPKQPERIENLCTKTHPANLRVACSPDAFLIPNWFSFNVTVTVGLREVGGAGKKNCSRQLCLDVESMRRREKEIWDGMGWEASKQLSVSESLHHGG